MGNSRPAFFIKERGNREMKISVGNEKFKGEMYGLQFEKGVADVSKEDEEKARKLARLIGYTIIEEPKEEPKKPATKKAATKKAASKKATKKNEDK